MHIIPKLENEELKGLYRKQWSRPILGILRVYLLIIATIGFGVYKGGWWLIPCIIVITALQHALSIFQHEAVHSLLFPNRKVNDFIGSYLISYPIGFSLDYRNIHLNHHKYLGTKADPDEYNYGNFPNTRATLVKKLLFEFSGLSAVSQFMRSSSVKSSKINLIGILITQFLIFTIFIFLGKPILYFILWLVPLVTITKGLTQMRNLAEHLIRNEKVDGAERIRTFKSNRFERFFLAPLNFNYHAEHHWYPMIPYYNLPLLRKSIQNREGYAEGAEWASSYIKTLNQTIL